MPELPEVEIIKRELNSKILQKIIIEVTQSDKRLRLPIPQLSILIGEKIINISRRNKYIILETNFMWVVIHLGMTGKLTIEDNNLLKKHTHYVIKLEDSSFIKYEDPRRFGLISLYRKVDFSKYGDIPLLINLGVEPLSDKFTSELIYNIIKNKKVAIKKIIMDSKLICGIGNIYASEILFLCGINPLEKGCNLSKDDAEDIRKNSIYILNKSISLGGSSISDYVHTNGSKGEMQMFYNVYGRYLQHCKACNDIIKKENLGGRTAYFCPTCQEMK